MRWENLRFNKCQHCGHDLRPDSRGIRFIRCTVCRFSISERRMSEIVMARNGRDVDMEMTPPEE